MNEISCKVCMDLIPLVQDGIASEDSREAVERHISKCESCAACYSGEIPPVADTDKLITNVRRKVQFFFIMLLMFGIFFGLGLTASSELFYNSLIMPIVGVFGYVIFRWKSLYAVPILLLFTNVISFVLNVVRGIEEIGMYSRVMWTGIYSIFVVVGIVIAGLIHYAFRKE